MQAPALDQKYPKRNVRTLFGFIVGRVRTGFYSLPMLPRGHLLAG